MRGTKPPPGSRLFLAGFDGNVHIPQSFKVRTADYEYHLPPELIAQKPAPARDASRMLVVHRTTQAIEHSMFDRLCEYLRAGDVLVLNNSKVVPARLRGANTATGGQFELLLIEENGVNDWWAMMRPGKRARIGTRITINDKAGAPAATATVLDTNFEGHRRLEFAGTPNVFDELERLGEVPLPPYIVRENPAKDSEDHDRYQTVFAAERGSVAAPTAGLHFTEGMLSRLREHGIQICFVTLHVGLGTFAPVKTEMISEHQMHEERYQLPAETVEAISAAKERGDRTLCVGTTTLRVLESVAPRHDGQLVPGSGKTRLFVYPPGDFRVADALLTNFHLPRSTLLMLVSAFAAPGRTAGRELILKAYSEAVRDKYRFFSYGDAMLIL